MAIEILVVGVAIIIVLLYQQQKQLFSIYNTLSNIIKNNKKENFNEQVEDDACDGKYNKSLDYIDNLARWVGENKDNITKGEVICHAKCNKLSGLSFSCDVDSLVNIAKQKDQSKDNIIKKYYLSFEGVMKSYYGPIPYMEDVCDFNFIIHFEENAKKLSSDVWIGQDFYNDIIDDTKYYDGKHTVTLEVYEDISEFEKYNALLGLGKNLGADVSFIIDVSKIKMNENMIDNDYVTHIGKLSWFKIFVIGE